MHIVIHESKVVGIDIQYKIWCESTSLMSMVKVLLGEKYKWPGFAKLQFSACCFELILFVVKSYC